MIKLKDYVKMTSPENKRKKIDNAVYGNKDGYVDYHLLEDYKIGDKKLKDILISQNQEIKDLKNFNNDLLEVIKGLNEKIKKIEGKVKDYGII